MGRLEQAREISIVSFLEKQGISPDDRKGNMYKYKSFFRPENDPSLIVYSDTNKFYDFGAPQYRGDLIDLVSMMEGLDTSDAITMILSECSLNNLPVHVPEPHENRIEIVSIEKFDPTPRPDGSDRSLMKYIRERRIQPVRITNECQQAFLRFPKSKNPERIHKVLAFKNDKGGYEFRNSYIKVSSSPKYFTSYRGDFRQKMNSDKTVTFEGFFDYLSFLSHRSMVKPNYPTFILNGISNMKHLLETYRGKNNLMYIDNDKTADEYLQILKSENIEYEDRRWVFKPYKDYNEAWADDFRRTKAASDTKQKLRSLYMGQ